MEVPLNMNNNTIINIQYDSVENSPVTNKVSKDTLLARDGSRNMTGNLDMNNLNIVNVDTPLSRQSFYAANVSYVNTTISDNNATINTLIENKIEESEAKIIARVNKKNAFRYIMDNPAGTIIDYLNIKGIGKKNKDYHLINKEVYEMQISHNASRLGLNLFPLPNGRYTMAFKLFYSNSSNIEISASSQYENITKVVSNIHSTDSRSIIHFQKSTSLTPNRFVNIFSLVRLATFVAL